jgi:hypothetical protein
MRMVLAAGLALVLAGCSGAGGGVQWAGTVTDSAGVQVVRNPATGVWQPGDQWTVTEALRIGTAEGDPEYQFGMVAGIALLSDGRIAVLDQQGQHVKLFGADGKYLQTIGKAGSGPGELGAATVALFAGPGDTLIVADMANQRVNLYQPDGTFLSGFRLGLEQGIPLRWDMTPDRRVITQVRSLNLPSAPGQQAAAPDTMDIILERRLDGSPGDTLMRVPSGRTFSFSGGRPEFNFFTAEPAWALYGDGILYGVNDQYRLGVYSKDGQLQRVIEKPFDRPPVTEADQQALIGLLENAWREAGVDQAAVAQLKSGIHFAPNYPAYLQALAGPDGTIWVQQLQVLSQLPEEQRKQFNPQLDMGSPNWEVFDAEGRFLGVATMPHRFQPMRFEGDKIYGIQRDELDVQYIVVLNVVKPGDDS